MIWIRLIEHSKKHLHYIKSSSIEKPNFLLIIMSYFAIVTISFVILETQFILLSF